jgi:dTMP kinase
MKQLRYIVKGKVVIIMSAHHNKLNFKSKFITLEGSEGVGKSTQIANIVQKIEATGCMVLVTREPGGTKLGEKVRELILYDVDKLEPMAELLLIFAARVQHLEQIVKPALANGLCVVCDRYIDSSFAYQGGGRNIAPDKITQLIGLINAPIPDCTILLDNDNLALALERARSVSDEQDCTQDKIERLKLAFFENVRQAYLRRATDNNYIHVVNANDTIDNVTTKIFKVLDEYFVTAT